MISIWFSCINVHFIIKDIRAIADTLNTHEVPGTVVSALHVLSHLIFTATMDQILWLPYSANKETETQSDYTTFQATELNSDLNPDCAVVELELLNISLKL